MNPPGEKSSINSRGFVTKPPCISASESTLLPVPETMEIPVHQKQNENLEEDSEELTSSTTPSSRNQLPYDRCNFTFLQDITRFTDDMQDLCGRGQLGEIVYQTDETKSSSAESSSENCGYSDDEQEVGQYEECCENPDDDCTSSIALKSSQLLSTDNNVSLSDTRHKSTSIFHSEFSSLSSIKIDYDFERDQKHFQAIQNALRCIIKKCLKAPEPCTEIDKYVPYLIMRLTSKVAEGLRKSKSISSLAQKQMASSKASLKRPKTCAAPISRFNRQDDVHPQFKAASTQTRPSTISRPWSKKSSVEAKSGISTRRDSSSDAPSFLSSRITEFRPLKKDAGKQPTTPRRALLSKRSPNSEVASSRKSEDKSTSSATPPLKTLNERPPWRFSAPKNPPPVGKPARQMNTLRNQQRRLEALLQGGTQTRKERYSPQTAKKTAGSPLRKVQPSPQCMPIVSNSEKDEDQIHVIHPPPDANGRRRLSSEYKTVSRPTSAKAAHRPTPDLCCRSPDRIVLRQNQNELRNQLPNQKTLITPRICRNENRLREQSRTVNNTTRPLTRRHDFDFRTIRIDGPGRRTIKSEIEENSCNPPYEGSFRVPHSSNRCSQRNWNTCHRNVEQNVSPNDRSTNRGDQAIVTEETASRKPSIPTILIVSGDFISRKNAPNYEMKNCNQHEEGDNLYCSYKAS